MEIPKDGLNAPVNLAQYLSTPEGEVWEIIDGIPFRMAAAPSPDHQRVLGKLYVEFFLFLRGKDCEVFQAPLDVALLSEGKSNEESKHVVQPDLAVICDKTKFEDNVYKGAPELVAEVLSPSTAHRDRDEKLKLYRRAGVKEYWIVDPIYKIVEVYDFHAAWPKRVYRHDEKVKVGVFQDELEIDLGIIFG